VFNRITIALNSGSFNKAKMKKFPIQLLPVGPVAYYKLVTAEYPDNSGSKMRVIAIIEVIISRLLSWQTKITSQ